MGTTRTASAEATCTGSLSVDPELCTRLRRRLTPISSQGSPTRRRIGSMAQAEEGHSVRVSVRVAQTQQATRQDCSVGACRAPGIGVTVQRRGPHLLECAECPPASNLLRGGGGFGDLTGIRKKQSGVAQDVGRRRRRPRRRFLGKCPGHLAQSAR